MMEPQQDVGEERPAPPGLRDMGTRLVVSVLGPNEEKALPRFLPYAPRYNLRPERKRLPIWALPLISAVLALVFVVPVSGGIRFLADQTGAEIGETRRKTELRLKEAAQYEAAKKRLGQVRLEKEALDKVAGGGPRWSVLLDRIRDQLPPGVRLTLITADARGKVTIEGESTNIRAVGTFMVYLRAFRDDAGQTFFERPRLFYSERVRRDIHSARLYKFQLTMRVPAASLALADEEAGASTAAESGELGAPRVSSATVSIGLPAPLTAMATGLEGNKALAEEARRQLMSE